VRYRSDALGVQVRQFKTPFAGEFITSLADVETADRAVGMDSFAPKRDIDIMADYDFGGGSVVTLNVFNGRGSELRLLGREGPADGQLRVARDRGARCAAGDADRAGAGQVLSRVLSVTLTK
jgi:hypothetical protein